MSYEIIAAEGSGSGSGSGTRRRSRQADEVSRDAAGDQILPFPGDHQIAYYHPEGCDAEGSDCPLEKIKAICHMNDTNADENPTDFFNVNEIKPPFLKGLYSNEHVDDDGNTYINGGKAQKNDSDNIRAQKGRGWCVTDGVGEDDFRSKTVENGEPDPFSRNEIVFVSKALTERQRIRPLFSRAMEAVTRDRAILNIVGDDFFIPPTFLVRNENGRIEEREDTDKRNAQDLAKVCGAEPNDDLTQEEREGFQEYKAREFDELFSSYEYNSIRKISFLSKVYFISVQKVFTHGSDAIGKNASAELIGEAIIQDDVTKLEFLVTHTGKVDVNARLKIPLEYYEDYEDYSYPVGEIPIVMAFMHGYFKSRPDYLRALLKNPTLDVNERSPDNDYPVLQLLSAIDHWHQLPDDKWKTGVLMLDMLLTDMRTNVHFFISNSHTALHNVCFHYADDSRCRWEMVVRMFLNAGANPLIKHAKGETSIDIVRKKYNGGYVVDLLTAAVTRNHDNHDLITRQVRKNAEDARARLRSGTVRAWAGVDRVPKLLRFGVTGSNVLVGDERGLVRLDADTGLISKEAIDPILLGMEFHTSSKEFSVDHRYYAFIGSQAVLKVVESKTKEVFRKENVETFIFHPVFPTIIALVVKNVERDPAHMEVQLWSTISRQLLYVFRNAGHPLAFSPDGKRLAMVSRKNEFPVVIENVVEHTAEGFLETEITRQTIDVDQPTDEHLAILNKARNLIIRSVREDDKLWRLGPHVPHVQSLWFIFDDPKKNPLSTLPDDLKEWSGLRRFEIRPESYFKEFPNVLLTMPSLRIIRFLDNKESLTTPMALREKMKKRLLRFENGKGTKYIDSELLWGFDGESEYANRLTDEKIRQRKDARVGPTLTHTGTQLLAFLFVRYNRSVLDEEAMDGVFSDYFNEEFEEEYRESMTPFEFALSRIFYHKCIDYQNNDVIDFRTLGDVDGKNGVLSEIGVEKFEEWFLSDDFERDMRKCAVHVTDDFFLIRSNEKTHGLAKWRAVFLYLNKQRNVNWMEKLKKLKDSSDDLWDDPQFLNHVGHLLDDKDLIQLHELMTLNKPRMSFVLLKHFANGNWNTVAPRPVFTHPLNATEKEERADYERNNTIYRLFSVDPYFRVHGKMSVEKMLPPRLGRLDFDLQQWLKAFLSFRKHETTHPRRGGPSR